MAVKTYSLKPMVVIRLLAEATALLALVASPVVLLILHRFQQLPFPARTIVCIIAVFALALLPLYGFITWRVSADDDGLTAISLYNKQRALWTQLKKLSFKSSWGFRRYVVSGDDCELTFPFWLVNVKELVALIRERIPSIGSSRLGGRRLFKQDVFGIFTQFGRVLMGLVFIVIFWSFLVTVHGGKTLGQGDYLLVLCGCLLATGLVGWRCLVLALIPRALELTGDGLIVRTCFFSRRVVWADVKALAPSYFLLPEGLMLKTAAGSFLLTEELDSIDELEQTIKEKLSG